MSDDGPISIDDGEMREGVGYVLSASLDSGNRIHLKPDTLQLYLSEIWSLADCYLKEIILEETIRDSVLTLTPQIKINTVSGDCPTPFFRPDTTLYLTVKDSWHSVKKIYVEGLPRNQLEPKSTDTSSIKDSIWLRWGSFSRDSIVIYVDSLFNDPYSMPRKTPGDTLLLRVVDSLRESVYSWRTVQAKCSQVMDECEKFVADTVWPSTWFVRDTAWVALRKSCKDTAQIYCLASDWVLDSASLGSVREKKDTTWFFSSYFIQKISPCASLNFFQLSALNIGRYWVGISEVWRPSTGEFACGPSSLLEWEMIRLSDLTEVRNTLLADSLLSEMKRASVGALVPPED